MIIKAGSITNLTDARFFASYAVDYIGFCFDPLSPNYISPQQALAIKGWLHNVKIVAEFANQDEDNVKGIVSFLDPDVIELDDSYFNDSQWTVGSMKLPVIRKALVNSFLNIEAGNYLFVLIEDYNEEDISKINFPIMIDITNKQIDLFNSKIAAIQIKGTRESEVGIKNYDELAELLELLIEK